METRVRFPLPAPLFKKFSRRDICCLLFAVFIWLKRRQPTKSPYFTDIMHYLIGVKLAAAFTSSDTPAQQPQRVADDDQIGKAHRRRAENRTDETQRRQRHTERVVKKRPEQILFDRPQRRPRQTERLRH